MFFVIKLLILICMFVFMLNNMKDTILKIDKTRLNYLVASYQDLQGKRCFTVICSLGRLRFRNIESVLDFIEMNKDLGYVE